MPNRLQVKVCVGSSCHVRGGTGTLKALEALIQNSGKSDFVELSADLCLDNCMEAPNVVVNGTVHGGITPERAEVFFRDIILPLVKSWPVQ
jgi:NADH:ubiquinone oxidoreductase subunit E